MADHGSSQQSGSAWAFAVVAFCAALVAGGLGLFAIVHDSNSASGTAATTAAASTVTETDITLADLSVSPNAITVPKGEEITLHVHNEGELEHDLKLDGNEGTDMLQPGQSETITLGPFDESAQAWCTVPGHKAAGMLLDINVAGTDGAGNGSTSGGGTGFDPDDATIDFTAEPAADFEPYDPAIEPAPGRTTHKRTFHVIDKVVEVAPGVKQLLWTFDEKVPGPLLRGKVGDVFDITLVNDGDIEHSIDFHASKVAWDDEMRSIKPGESLRYQYRANYAGIFMYHCGTAPALHHIGNGMYGAVIIDPPTLAPVDHEYAIVQSELYLGPDGEVGDLAKMAAFAPDAVVFNGYVNQYLHRPIRVEPNERVRVWVLDAGPSENSAFHIVGTVFDTVFKEGAYLLQPDARQGGAQALDLQPAQGGFVEFSLAERGLYPIVTHKFSNVGKGAPGLFQAGEARAPAGGAAH
jgi:nitrite reductase (NO-forming)